MEIMNNTIIETTDEKPCGNFTVLPLTEPSKELQTLMDDMKEINKKFNDSMRIPNEYFRKSKG